MIQHGTMDTNRSRQSGPVAVLLISALLVLSACARPDTYVEVEIRDIERYQGAVQWAAVSTAVGTVIIDRAKGVLKAQQERDMEWMIIVDDRTGSSMCSGPMGRHHPGRGAGYEIQAGGGHPGAVIGEKGFGSDDFIAYIEALEAEVSPPPKKNQTIQGEIDTKLLK